MSDIISDTVPINLFSEKEKFFTDPTYNPQFQYKRPLNARELSVWGQPIKALYDHSVKMLSDYRFSIKEKVPILQEDVTEYIQEFNQKYRLNPSIEVFFSTQFLSRCRIAHNKIYFQLPISYSSETFRDLCRHELETHFFRSVNDIKQPWHDRDFPDQLFRRTEEGLAGLHTYLERESKKMHKTYRTYMAVYLAQTQSFSFIFHELKKVGMSDQISWQAALRSKRGIEDTSLPGGLTKDICYLEGAIQVWQWLMDKSHNPKDLYLGRVDISELPKIGKSAHRDGLYYPSFFDNMERYYQNIEDIGKVNEFELLWPHLN
ncbi:MAG TPA: tyrosine/phenylalanine carboxypeptidase domain-containing protein [Flavobacterium sp.]|uniref:tyrosine/phenylalanine carboxypeptidase domain-containing protein n=1 Tax=Flavobacterium sp. TaxID=239 RepID=UPI002ED255D9